MNNFNFLMYSEDEEVKTDDKIGEYWKFLDIDVKEYDQIGITSHCLGKTILQIKNSELKEKMKERLISYIRYKGVLDGDIASCYFKGILSKDEASKLIDGDKFINKIQSDDKTRKNPFFQSYCNYYVDTCLIIDDLDFQSEHISNLIDEIVKLDKSDEYMVGIMKTIMLANKKEIFDLLFEKYSNNVPDTFKKFVQVSNDNEYIYRKSLDFEAKNVRIGIDPKIKIGVEIETNHPYYLSLSCNNQKTISDMFKTGDDVTVPNGVEIVSKPFNDTTSDISKFCALCETLSEVGYYYDEESENASGQINLGLDYLDSAQSIINFYELFCNVEELLFYISNGDNQLTRQSLSRSSRFKPISEIIGIRDIDENISRDELIAMFNSRTENESNSIIQGLLYKKNTLCLRGTYEDDYRFEIRIPNGGNDYKIWMDNIRLYGKMMEVSKYIADLKNKDYLTDEDEKKLNILYDLKYNRLDMDEKLVDLMDLLFSEPEIKKIYYERYVNTLKKIKETNTDKYYVPYALKTEPIFGRTNLNEIPNSKIDDEPVATYDPETGEYYENRTKRTRF